MLTIYTLCRYEDRNSTTNSLEMRTPFLDYRLISFCMTLSNDFKIKNGSSKHILRNVMNELPVKIIYRKHKKVFSIPEKKFLRNELDNNILSISKYSILDEMRIIIKQDFINYYKDFLNNSGQYTEFTDITRVYIAEKWSRNDFK